MSAPAILAIGTAVPSFSERQALIGDWMADSFEGQPAVQRLIRSLYHYSGIERRYSCTDEFQRPVSDSAYAPSRCSIGSPGPGSTGRYSTVGKNRR